MKKNTKTFNALKTLTEVAKLMESSTDRMIRLYDPEFTASGNADERSRRKPDNQLISAMEPQLREQVDQLGRFLKTTPLETLLFVAVFAIQLINNSSVDTRDISRYLDINGLDFLPLKPVLHSLLKKRLIRVVNRRRSTNDYIVADTVEHSLLLNKPVKRMKAQEMDQFQFCNLVSGLIECRSNEDFDTRELFIQVEREEEANPHIKLVKELRKLSLDIEERTLFYEICDDFVRDRRRNTGVECTLNDIYDNLRHRFDIAKNIMSQSHPLMQSELAELLPAKFLAEAEIALTEKGKRLLLDEDYDLFCGKGGSDKRLLPPDKIPARELFFSEELSADLDFVKESLQEEKFVELQKRLEENSLPKGVAMLFHGLPGTGKTAAVDMIAKATGRSVYHVDIAASKTCWFGESEKLFKRIFTDYRRMCETEERKPILLFNEADALFSKRRDVDSGNCAQTENALQNILLEEMETLDGILIATTNLCDNFDSAFERRFLFKVQFGQPNTAAKKAIWKSKLSWLTEDDCDRLAAKYDLSGGEIDNIVRKSMMEEVLSGNRPDVEMLEAWCRGEKLTRKGGNAIGFAC
ncbi:MAG: ATP-binding protein [Bacteroidales bacterium]|nr:ATP-binding protein [Bacteroidales bacterium]